jgi:hypothetical protein
MLSTLSTRSPISGAVLAGLAAAVALGASIPARADSDSDLAKKLQNPVANLISVPLQNNVDFAYQASKTTR